MHPDEVVQFETNPYLEEIIQVRLVDDAGRVEHVKPLPFCYFTGLLQDLVDDHCGKTF